ncbi:adenylylsulfate kinase [Halobacillus karajensis]|uniref:adenylyl-sulfate kinase n=1 Tax=Halobacillus karajensis TaxID=195088 RepID=UPI0008A7C2E4|nr:adenylyl-sulfate kinase [Halobacillus karajensis]SEH72132.1 adenylylsulfate kinase [Halobacillus karajensis]
MATNITWHEEAVKTEDYRKMNGHHSGVLWLTGLSGSGKSSIANLLNQRLHEKGLQTYVLDGDNVRHGLNADLGFSEADREENIRRIGETAKLFANSGTIVLVAFISPYQKDRDKIRASLPKGDFIEVYVDCPLEECEARDPKGLYQKARNGEIKGFTGIDAPYEAPKNPEIVINSGDLEVTSCVDQLVKLLQDKKWVD